MADTINYVSVVENIIVGAAGGLIAGLSLWAVDYTHKSVVRMRHRLRLEKWLLESEDTWRSTRAIASNNNLTEDRVRFICSWSQRIKLNAKHSNKSDEMWAHRDNLKKSAGK